MRFVLSKLWCLLFFICGLVQADETKYQKLSEVCSAVYENDNGNAGTVALQNIGPSSTYYVFDSYVKDLRQVQSDSSSSIKLTLLDNVAPSSENVIMTYNGKRYSLPKPQAGYTYFIADAKSDLDPELHGIYYGPPPEYGENGEVCIN